MIEQEFYFIEDDKTLGLYYKIEQELDDMLPRGFHLKQFQIFENIQQNSFRQPFAAYLLFERNEDMKESKEKRKVKKVMTEFKEATLHSGSKKGPAVKNPKQAIAIAISESRKGKK